MSHPKKITRGQLPQRVRGRPRKNGGDAATPAPAYKAFAQRLDMLRRERGQSMSQFARQCGVTPTNMSAYLAGRIQPGYDLLLRISERLGHVSLDWLMFGGSVSPQYRGQRRTSRGLERDVAAYVRNAIDAAEARGLGEESGIKASSQLGRHLLGRVVESALHDFTAFAAQREVNAGLRAAVRSIEEEDPGAPGSDRRSYVLRDLSRRITEATSFGMARAGRRDRPTTARSGTPRRANVFDPDGELRREERELARRLFAAMERAGYPQSRDIGEMIELSHAMLSDGGVRP